MSKPQRWDERLADQWDLAAKTTFKDCPDVAMAYQMCAAELRQCGYWGASQTAHKALRLSRQHLFELARSWRDRAAELGTQGHIRAQQEVVLCARELEDETDGTPGREAEE